MAPLAPAPELLIGMKTMVPAPLKSGVTTPLVGVYLGPRRLDPNFLYRLLNICDFPILTIRVKMICQYLKCEKAL